MEANSLEEPTPSHGPIRPGFDERAGPQARARRTPPVASPRLFTLIADVMSLLFAGLLAAVAPLWSAGPPGPLPTAVFAAGVLTILAWRGAYARLGLIRPLEDLRLLLAALSLASMGLLSAWVLSSGSADAAYQTATLAVYAALLLAAGRVGLTSAFRRALREGGLRKPTLILGAGRISNLAAERLIRQPQLGLEPVGFIDDDPMQLPGRRASLPVLGGLDDLDHVLDSHKIEHVIVGFSTAAHEEMLSLVWRCWDVGVSVSLVPRLFEVEGDRQTIEWLGGLPLISVGAPSSGGLSLAVKYALDRTAGALLLLVLSPLLAVLALAIKLSVGGPVLYGQARVGRDGQNFTMWKFCTMNGSPEDDGEADAAWAEAIVASGSGDGPHLPVAMPADAPADRRTPVGRWLRRLSLDELPQLVNIVRGEMSFVGPRPERVHYVERFEGRVYRYRDRHRVKSGLTGWAQVHGLRGNTSLADRVEWDNYYIENWSLWLDFKILVRTFTAVLEDAVSGRDIPVGGRPRRGLRLAPAETSAPDET